MVAPRVQVTECQAPSATGPLVTLTVPSDPRCRQVRAPWLISSLKKPPSGAGLALLHDVAVGPGGAQSDRQSTWSPSPGSSRSSSGTTASRCGSSGEVSGATVLRCCPTAAVARTGRPRRWFRSSRAAGSIRCRASCASRPPRPSPRPRQPSPQMPPVRTRTRAPARHQPRRNRTSVVGAWPPIPPEVAPPNTARCGDAARNTGGLTPDAGGAGHVGRPHPSMHQSHSSGHPSLLSVRA